MLTTSRIWLVAASAAVVALTAGVAVAAALGPDRLRGPTGAVVLLVQDEDDEICPPTERECSVEREEEEEDPGNPGEDGGGGGPRVCTYGSGGPITASDESGEETAIVLVAQGRVVPCYIEGRGWYDGTQCYYGAPAFNHDTTPPEGSTEEEGQWYQKHCIWGFTGDTMLLEALLEHEWVEFGDVPTVSPLELAQRAIAAVGLDGVEFQLAPPDTGAGLVGLPVWLGVANDPNTTYWGPIDGESECDGDLCVSITARVVSVDWTMGDGTVFSCDRDNHTVWQRGQYDFLAPGENCHHYYHQASRDLPDGRYPISATSNWLVEWETTSGGGEFGEIPTDRTSDTSLEIDEIQVLTGR